MDMVIDITASEIRQLSSIFGEDRVKVALISNILLANYKGYKNTVFKTEKAFELAGWLDSLGYTLDVYDNEIQVSW